MVYESVFELLEAVYSYELKEGECIVPLNSEKGTHVGYCTADGEDPSVRWLISIRDLKRSAEGSPEIYQQMRLYHTRRELLQELLSGKLPLERPEPEPLPESKQDPKLELSPEEEELEDFVREIGL